MLRQLGTEHLLSRQDFPQDQAEEMVSEDNTSNLPAVKATKTRPAYLRLELFQAEAARIKQRRGRTAGDVIAGKSECV